MAKPTKETKPPTDAYRCKMCKNNITYNLGKVCTRCLDKEEGRKSHRGRKRPLY